MTDSDQTKAIELRTKALGLLQEAQALDGLKPFIVNHRHEYGSTSYMCWFNQEPTADEAADVLVCVFEPDRGEEINIESVTLDELTGVSLSSRLAEESGDHAVEGECPTVTKNKVNGSWQISDVYDGHLVERTYYGYTREEAIQLFREEVYNAKD